MNAQLAIPLILLCAASLLACQQDEPDVPKIVRPVRTLVVVEDGGDSTRTFTGISRASDQTKLSFRVAGLLSELNVKLGSVVKKQDLIARLDASDLQLQAHQASNDLAQAQASRSAAQAEFERIRKLYESNSASRSQYDQARSSARQAEASVGSSRKQLQLARNKVKYTELRAPNDGRVASLAAKSGENVTAGQAILTLAQGGEPEVLVNVASVFIGEVQLGDTVVVTFPDMTDREYKAVVQEISVAPEEEQTTFPVVASLQNPDKDVRLGLTARVQFATNKTGEGIRIPTVAVSEDSKGRFVYVADSGDQEGLGTVRRVDVEIKGEPSSTGIWVTQGLKPGDHVITAGVSRVAEGQVVRVLKAEQ